MNGVQAQNLLYPAGEIRPELFPERSQEDLVNDLQTWLDERAGEDGVDDAARVHWAYYRAYSAVASRIAATPASINVPGAIGVSVGSGAVAHFAQLAKQKFEAFEARVAANLAGGSGARKAVSRSTPVRFIW